MKLKSVRTTQNCFPGGFQQPLPGRVWSVGVAYYATRIAEAKRQGRIYVGHICPTYKTITHPRAPLELPERRRLPAEERTSCDAPDFEVGLPQDFGRIRQPADERAGAGEPRAAARKALGSRQQGVDPPRQ